MMRLLVVSLAVLAAATPAMASSQSCTRAGDVRTVEVVTPGVIGAACDMKYVRENGNNISVPYHADYSASFCAERAAALVASLIAAGYTCTETVAPLREVQAEPQAATLELAGAAPDADAADAAAPFESAAGEIIPEPPVAQKAYPDAPIVAEIPVETAEPSILEQPPVAANEIEVAEALPAPVTEAGDESIAAFEEAVASRGPTALSTTLASAPVTTKAPGTSVVGRLVGAAPDATPVAQPAVVSTEERLSPVAMQAPAVAETPAKLASLATPPSGARPAADIIRGVLSAQAAAWNEGDLEAFMGGYWKSPDVRFVSGTTVTKGWQQTLKRYRERYGQGSSLGRLSFESLDVQMVTDDVAVIIGRFNLATATAAETGAFTLVMKRFDGLWRIVHDHSVGDPAPKQ